jgi:hypothetical protein
MHKIVSLFSSISVHYNLAYNETEDVKHVFVTSNFVMTKLCGMDKKLHTATQGFSFHIKCKENSSYCIWIQATTYCEKEEGVYIMHFTVHKTIHLHLYQSKLQTKHEYTANC